MVPMARTYEYDPSQIGEGGKDQMRFELGDTMVEGGPETSALCDEEYVAILAKHPTRWKRAKLACLESIFRRFAYEPDTKTGPLSFAFGARAKLWRDDYYRLKAELEAESVTIPQQMVEGSGKPPYFYGDMHQNWEARPDETHHVPAAWKHV